MGEGKSTVARLRDGIVVCSHFCQRFGLFLIPFALITLAIGVFLFMGWIQRGKTIRNLRAESRELMRELREVESENNGLRDTIAPLIGPAFSEFPGEEISSALKKIIDRLERQDAQQRPIVSPLALVEIVIDSDIDVDTHHMDGGHVAFCRGHETLLEMSADNSNAVRLSKTKTRYSTVLEMPATDSVVGKFIAFIGGTEYLQVKFATIPEKGSVTEGKAIVIINASHRLEFQVPAQNMQAGKLFVQAIRDSGGLFEEIRVQAGIPANSSGQIDKAYKKHEVEEAVNRYFKHAFQTEVRGPLSIEQVEQESLKSVLMAISKNVRRDIPQVPFGFAIDRWNDFKQQLRGGDLIFYFISDKNSWSGLGGRAGYVLIRDGEVADMTITTMN